MTLVLQSTSGVAVDERYKLGFALVFACLPTGCPKTEVDKQGFSASKNDSPIV